MNCLSTLDWNIELSLFKAVVKVTIINEGRITNTGSHIRNKTIKCRENEMIHYFTCITSSLCIAVCYLLENSNVIKYFEIKFTRKWFIRLVHFGGKSYMYLNLIILIFIILVCDYMFCPLKLTFEWSENFIFCCRLILAIRYFSPRTER